MEMVHNFSTLIVISLFAVVENTCKLFWSPILQMTASFWLLRSWLFY